MPDMKRINGWVDAINNYYAFALLVYTVALFAASYSNVFVLVFILATPVVAVWGGYLTKSYFDRRTLRHGFRIETDVMSYEIGANRRYKLHYDTKLKAGRDNLMVYPISYQWTGSGDESIPKIKGKGLQLMAPVTGGRKPAAYGTSSSSTDGDWRFWFIALNPPVHKGDIVDINYTQEFFDKRGEANPCLYYFARIPMKRLTLNVMFAKGATPSEVTCSYIKPSRPDRPFETTGVEYDRAKHWATWVIENPKVGYCYRINWKNEKKS
jgi:hypothetical protein